MLLIFLNVIFFSLKPERKEALDVFRRPIFQQKFMYHSEKHDSFHGHLLYTLADMDNATDPKTVATLVGWVIFNGMSK